ncbi:MAG: hypothetical protein QNJ18_23690 [Xenococcaceae cyanobacterium MO_167.B52]|nr:hypothetical protein [Xenococcaceae cyanobacterium MO_167.B52]
MIADRVIGILDLSREFLSLDAALNYQINFDGERDSLSFILGASLIAQRLT